MKIKNLDRRIGGLALVIPASLILGGCTLPWASTGPISGTVAALKLADVLKNGGKADCKITNLADNTTTEILVNGKKMKYVMNSPQGRGGKSMMINDGQFVYTWSDGDKTGIKMSAIVPSVTPTGKPANVPDQPDIDKEADMYNDETKFKMDCSAGSVSDADFVPPTDVTFTDVEEMMKAAQSIPKGMPSLPTGYKVPAGY